MKQFFNFKHVCIVRNASSKAKNALSIVPNVHLFGFASRKQAVHVIVFRPNQQVVAHNLSAVSALKVGHWNSVQNATIDHRKSSRIINDSFIEENNTWFIHWRNGIWLAIKEVWSNSQGAKDSLTRIHIRFRVSKQFCFRRTHIFLYSVVSSNNRTAGNNDNCGNIENTIVK